MYDYVCPIKHIVRAKSRMIRHYFVALNTNYTVLLLFVAKQHIFAVFMKILIFKNYICFKISKYVVGMKSTGSSMRYKVVFIFANHFPDHFYLMRHLDYNIMPTDIS